MPDPIDFLKNPYFSHSINTVYRLWALKCGRVESSVGDPDPDQQDRNVFGPPRSGSKSEVRIRLRLRILPFSHKCVEWTEIMHHKKEFSQKVLTKNWIFKPEDDVNNFLTSLKSLKKGVRSRVGSGYGSISQRYGSGDPDPGPRQNVTDPQYSRARVDYLVMIEQNSGK